MTISNNSIIYNSIIKKTSLLLISLLTFIFADISDFTQSWYGESEDQQSCSRIRITSTDSSTVRIEATIVRTDSLDLSRYWYSGAIRGDSLIITMHDDTLVYIPLGDTLKCLEFERYHFWGEFRGLEPVFTIAEMFNCDSLITEYYANRSDRSQRTFNNWSFTDFITKADRHINLDYNWGRNSIQGSFISGVWHETEAINLSTDLLFFSAPLFADGDLGVHPLQSAGIFGGQAFVYFIYTMFYDAIQSFFWVLSPYYLMNSSFECTPRQGAFSLKTGFHTSLIIYAETFAEVGVRCYSGEKRDLYLRVGASVPLWDPMVIYPERSLQLFAGFSIERTR